ncbi:MAG: hypothetical protein WBE76_09995, partial [Terracidiphilus sp.]
AAPSAPPAPPSFTPVAAPPQPGFAPVQSGYAPPPPVYPPAAVGASGARPGGGGSTAVKIVLIIVAIFVGIGILGASVVGYGIWRVSHAIRAASHGGTVTIPGAAGGGSFSLNSSQKFTASELGTDIYPGAVATQGGMRMITPNGSWITGIFLTSDSRDQVLNFYKSKFGSDSALMETNDAAILTLKKTDKETVMVTISAKPNEDNGRTKIAILHTVSKT